MFPQLFRKLYLRAKVQIEAENAKRIAQETPPNGVSCAEHTYLEDGDLLHKLNLYKPDSCQDMKSLPFVIDIHGGGWICGDKDTNSNFCSHLAADGVEAAALSYRTLDRCTLREQIQDIFAFFHWVETHHEEYELCMNQVFLTGDSAGAQLALLVYCVNQNHELQELFSVAPVKFCVKGLILNHGVCYLNEAATLPNKKLLSRCFLNPGLLEMLFGKGYAKCPLYLQTTVPGSYLPQQTALPPILLITSKGDRAFSYQTIRLHNELQERKVNCKLYYEESADAAHVFNIAYPDSESGKRCNQRILDFIRSMGTHGIRTKRFRPNHAVHQQQLIHGSVHFQHNRCRHAGRIRCLLNDGKPPHLVQMLFAFVFALVSSILFMTILSKIQLQDAVYIPLIGMMYGGIIKAVASAVAYQANALQTLLEIGLGTFDRFTSFDMLYLILIPLVLAVIYATSFSIAVISAAAFATVGSILFVGLIIPNIVTAFYRDDAKKHL